MSEKFYSLLTNIGKAKIANSVGLGTKINFVTMKVGDGGGAYYEPTEDQIDLKNTVWSGNINHVEIDTENPSWINIEVMIPSTVGGFTIREYGAFDEEGNMLGICKTAESYKPVIADGSTKELLLTLVLAVSNTESVTLKIDPTIIFAKKSEVEQLRTDITAQLSELTQDRIYYCGATSGTNTYTATNSKITAYTEGLTVRVKIGTNSTGSSTLNINGIGAKTILDTLGNPITSGGLKAELPYQLCYNGTNFIVLGKGGGGDATAAQLLLGKKATVDIGPIVGTLDLTNLITGNIKSGVNINGVSGKTSVVDTADATVVATQMIAGYTGYVNGSKITGTATLTSLGGKRCVNGTIYHTFGTANNITLPFTPTLVVLKSSTDTLYYVYHSLSGSNGFWHTNTSFTKAMVSLAFLVIVSSCLDATINYTAYE